MVPFSRFDAVGTTEEDRTPALREYRGGEFFEADGYELSSRNSGCRDIAMVVKSSRQESTL